MALVKQYCPVIPRRRENPDHACQTAATGFYRVHDPTRVPGQRRARRSAADPSRANSTRSRRDSWGLMHKHITHNRCYETFRDFSDAILTFLREEVPRNWHLYCDTVTDNFPIISPKEFRVLA